MKNIHLGLAGLSLAGALAAFGASLWLVHAAPGLTLGAVVREIATGGALTVIGMAALAVVVVTGAGLVLRGGIAGRIVTILLWLAGLTAIGWAVFLTCQLFLRIKTVSAHVGGLDFAIQAPGYADAVLILANGLAIGALAFAAAYGLQVRKAGMRR